MQAKLTDVQCRVARPRPAPYKLADGAGLYLDIRPSGGKYWRYRYRLDGRAQTHTIGEYPAVTVREAREALLEIGKLVRTGLSPTKVEQTAKARRRAEAASSFQVVAEEWMAKKRRGWTDGYARKVSDVLKADVFPRFGDLPVREVTAYAVLEAMQAAEARGATTIALLIRQWCSAVFRYAAATLRADHDPAAALRGAILRGKTKHNTPLAQSDIKPFLQALEIYRGNRTTVIAIKLLLLTFVRTGELRAAEWPEFDLDKAIWRIPAGRMKMRDGHIVPLSTQAVALLRELHTITGPRQPLPSIHPREPLPPLLFPNTRDRGRCLSMTTVNRALERMGYAGRDTMGFSAHGFRGTASTMLNEMGFPPDIIERQLAHKPRNQVRASYNRAEYLDARKAMMQHWADWLDEMADAKK